jgi:hypothetical protein
MVPVLAWSATIAETTLAVTLIAGVGVRCAAFGSAVLLAWFATAMLVYTGLKPPLDNSVFSASACAAARVARAPTGDLARQRRGGSRESARTALMDLAHRHRLR